MFVKGFNFFHENDWHCLLLVPIALEIRYHHLLTHVLESILLVLLRLHTEEEIVDLVDVLRILDYKPYLVLIWNGKLLLLLWPHLLLLLWQIVGIHGWIEVVHVLLLLCHEILLLWVVLICLIEEILCVFVVVLWVEIHRVNTVGGRVGRFLVSCTEPWGREHTSFAAKVYLLTLLHCRSRVKTPPLLKFALHSPVFLHLTEEIPYNEVTLFSRVFLFKQYFLVPFAEWIT